MIADGEPQAANCGPQVISFGEIVFDHIVGKHYLGGAPLNFACYLRQFGVPVALVSAVGHDKLGQTALRSLSGAGVDTSRVETRPQPTGTVEVRLVEGDAEFIVADGCAWEQIELSGAPFWGQPALLYFGTVAQKTATNRASLEALCALRPRDILLDINLRPQQYSAELVMQVLKMATILRMNENEWQVVRQITSQNGPDDLLESHGLEMIALTRGSQGAELHLPERTYIMEGRKTDVVDPVGAGDAFTAALAAGIVRGADMEHALRVACEAGAAAVQSRGALVDLPVGLRSAFVS